MKLQGIFGKGSGKVGSSVWSVSGGEQVIREYNPRVANPNTVPQVNQRARLKMASQMAAALSPIIAMPKEGLSTTRNQFIKKNIENFYANNGEVIVSYENLQLTKGNVGIPSISLDRSGDNLVIALQESAATAVDRMVYCVMRKTNEGKLQALASQIVSAAGVDGTFQASFTKFTGEIVVYAYGMKDKDAAATAKYGSYNCQSGEDVARLIMNRTITTADVTLTATRGTTLFSNEDASVTLNENERMVYITASGPGSVSGTGFANGRKKVTIGESVSVTATADEDCEFIGWFNNGQVSGTALSTAATYTFTASDTADLVAMFNDPNSNNGGGNSGPTQD